MGAFFDDATLVHDHQPVHGRDGGEPMRHRDDGLSFHQRVEIFLNGLLHFEVERAGGLVEHQDRRVLEQHARDGDALALPARELHTALADMRVVTLPPLRIDKMRDELVGMGLAGCRLDVCHARVGIAVADVVDHGTVQQRGVLRHHADRGAQRILRRPGDILSVDQDAALLQVVEAEQQIGQRRLARAGTPDEPHLLARPDGEIQVIDHGAAAHRCDAAIIEGHVLEADFAPADDQGAGVLVILDAALARNGLDAVLDDADVLEEAGHFPDDPLRHGLDAQREADGKGDGPGGDGIVVPQRDRDGGHGEDQHAREDLQRRCHERRQAHGAVDRVQHPGHAFLGIAVLAVVMGEELDGGDVCVAVHHPAGDQRAHIGLFGRDAAEPRHEVPAGGHIAGQPDQHGHHEPEIAGGHQHQGADEVDADIDDDLGELHHRIAHAQCGLHHLGGDAPGEVVGEEVHALAQDIAVRGPADAHGIIAAQALMRNGFGNEVEQRQNDEHHRAHHDELGAMVLPEGFAVRCGEKVDEVAEEGEEIDFEEGDGGRKQHRHRQQRPEGLGIVPGKGQQARRRHLRPVRRKGINPAFKPVEEAVEHG